MTEKKTKKTNTKTTGPSPAQLLKEKRAERKATMDSFAERRTQLQNKRKEDLQACTSTQGAAVKELNAERWTKREALRHKLDSAVKAAVEEYQKAEKEIAKIRDLRIDDDKKVFVEALKKLNGEHHELMKVPWEEHKKTTGEIEADFAEDFERLNAEEGTVMSVLDQEVRDLELEVLGPPKKEKAKVKPAPQAERTT
jgi:molybdopterin converting factor small subunit